jgi:hypothetical protein
MRKMFWQVTKPQKQIGKTEEQQHYESLISFFKYCVTVSGIIIGVISSIAITFSYRSNKEMKDEYANTLKDLTVKIDELKSDAKQTTDEIKRESKETEKSIKEQSYDYLSSTKEYSEKEISRISSSTNAIALDETKKQLDYIFSTDKIQNLIQNQAVKEVTGKVQDIVNKQTENINDISDAAAQMRMEKPKGLKRLLYYIKSGNAIEASTAKRLFDDIAPDFYSSYTTDTSDFGISIYPPDSILLRKTLDTLRSGVLPKNNYTREQVEIWMQSLNSDFESLYQIAYIFNFIRNITRKEMAYFDFEAARDWYNSLKK